MPNKSHYSVNWVNGMKITRDHLLEQDASFQHLLFSNLQFLVSPLNFGLLPLKDSLEIDLVASELSLRRCSAVLPSGIRFDIGGPFGMQAFSISLSELLTESDSLEDELYVMIQISPFEKVPFGNPLQDEFPIRKPYLVPSYQIGILHNKSSDTAYQDVNSMPVSRIIRTSNGYQVDKNYIPPCLSIRSYPLMESKFNSFLQKMREIEGYLIQIRLKTRKLNSSEPTQLSLDAQELTEQILGYIVFNKSLLRIRLPEGAPVDSVIYFSTLATIVNDVFSYIGDKEGMLAYFNYWVEEYTPIQIQSCVEKLQNIRFSPVDIQNSFSLIDEFLSTFQKIFQKLSQREFRDMWKPVGVLNNSNREFGNQIKISRKNIDENSIRQSSNENNWYRQ
jgi:hypothetical protein